jgi:hypothetical protein
MRNREHMLGDQRCAGSAIDVRRQFRHYFLEVERQGSNVIGGCGHLLVSVALRVPRKMTFGDSVRQISQISKH